MDLSDEQFHFELSVNHKFRKEGGQLKSYIEFIPEKKREALTLTK